MTLCTRPRLRVLLHLLVCAQLKAFEQVHRLIFPLSHQHGREGSVDGQGIVQLRTAALPNQAQHAAIYGFTAGLDVANNVFQGFIGIKPLCQRHIVGMALRRAQQHLCRRVEMLNPRTPIQHDQAQL